MIIHLVREGERLSDIAARYQTTTDAIVDRNQHRPAVQLPSGERVFASLAAGDELLVLGASSGGGGFAGMANPAAVYCDELGGKFPNASSGDCMLPNGTVCDEWALFRGECPGWPGAPPGWSGAEPPSVGGSCGSRRMDTDPVTGACIPRKDEKKTAEIKTEAWISKPMIAGGLAMLGLAIGTGAIVFLWPKK